MTAQLLGPQNGTLEVKTYREGVAQKIGHDLIIAVERWDAAVERSPDGLLRSVSLNADPHSLRIREGHRGVKPLTDKDRNDIRATIDEKVLRGKPIRFESTAIEPHEGGVSLRGELTMAETTREATFELELSSDGRIAGVLPVTQSEWGIKPYRGLLGALKVRDTVEIAIDVHLSAA